MFCSGNEKTQLKNIIIKNWSTIAETKVCILHEKKLTSIYVEVKFALKFNSLTSGYLCVGLARVIVE